MLDIDIKGINSVGRIYRPNSIVNSYKRGMVMYTKYKSNFGGALKNIEIEINLSYCTRDCSDILTLKIYRDDKNDIELAVCEDDFKRISENEVISKEVPKEIKTYRKLIKLDMYNLKNKKDKTPIQLKVVGGILYCDFFIDSINEDEQERASMAIYPTVIDGKEYLFIQYESSNPILIKDTKNIKIC